MTIQHDIEWVLSHEGRVSVTRKGASANPSSFGHNTFLRDHLYEYDLMQIMIDTGNKEITRVMVPQDYLNPDAINIRFKDGRAIFGEAPPPPCTIFSSNFSGCSFYLYHQGPVLRAVHAHRGKAGGVSRLIDPTKYISYMGGKMIWSYATLGKIKDTGVGVGKSHFVGIICHLDHTDAYCFAYEYYPEDKEHCDHVTKLLCKETVHGWPGK
jgi:hypothetical protein